MLDTFSSRYGLIQADGDGHLHEAAHDHLTGNDPLLAWWSNPPIHLRGGGNTIDKGSYSAAAAPSLCECSWPRYEGFTISPIPTLAVIIATGAERHVRCPALRRPRSNLVEAGVDYSRWRSNRNWPRSPGRNNKTFVKTTLGPPGARQFIWRGHPQRGRPAGDRFGGREGSLSRARRQRVSADVDPLPKL